MKVRFTPDAEEDLSTIADWIAQHDPDAALRLIRQLRGKAIELGAMPLAFPMLVSRDGVTLRKRTHRMYVIVYRVTMGVEIVRVLDARRNYLPLLDQP